MELLDGQKVSGSTQGNRCWSIGFQEVLELVVFWRQCFTKSCFREVFTPKAEGKCVDKRAVLREWHLSDHLRCVKCLRKNWQKLMNDRIYRHRRNGNQAENRVTPSIVIPSYTCRIWKVVLDCIKKLWPQTWTDWVYSDSFESKIYRTGPWRKSFLRDYRSGTGNMW